MISKSEWHEWKTHKVTQRLLELMKAGKEAAIEELVSNRKSVGDYQRGAIGAYDDIAVEILRGENIVEVDE